jgi:hypothetical protein
MSQCYNIELQAENVTEEKDVSAIREVFDSIWNLEDEGTVGTTCYFQDNGVLHAVHPADFSEEMANEVWGRLGKYVPLKITTTYLEEYPVETYEYNEENYKVATGREATKKGEIKR